MRVISISICILGFSIYLLYYGPVILASKFSFTVYVNALVVTSSELVIYPFILMFIEKLPRKKTAIVLFSVCGVSSFALIFVVRFLCENSESPKCTLLGVL
jgi:di/tricarboxylate transporter